MVSLPTGAVTILFTDIEGSTRLLQKLGSAAYGQLLGEHHRVMRAALAAHGGIEVKTEGDAFFVLFLTAEQAVAAAVAAQRELAASEWPGDERVAVRMGIHAGVADLVEDEYVGIDVNRAARISSAAHGGQVLLSGATAVQVAPSLPAGVSLRELGEHRLKDIDLPERLVQLVIAGLPADFPPPHALATRFNLLPTELSSFVGRADVLAQARELLPGTRLLTLTGPGGTGKTRLSIRIAHDAAEDFADGVAFVPLASISDPTLVLPTVRQTLGLAEEPDRSALQTLAERLAGRNALIVLDNFEQVASAAPSVAALLDAAHELTIMVTSRVALHLSGEQELPIPPLAIPPGDAALDLDRLSRSEAIALFVQRARSVRPDFALTQENAAAIVGICTRLDGLPLAIELAASRIKLLPPAALLARLRESLDVLQSTAADRTDRQRTLRGAIDWSYGLLTAADQALYRRCAVFVGGWRLDDLEAVVKAAGALDVDLLEGIGALVDQSLVRQVEQDLEPRFTMLSTIRDFGHGKLAESGELEATATSHAHRFATLVEEAEPSLTSGGEWLDRLEADHDNIRAALAWLADHDVESALMMAGRAWRFWHLRGHLREGAALLSGLLQRPGASHSSARAKALIGLAGLVYWQTDYELARTAYEEARSIAAERGDAALEVEALYSLAYVRGIALDWDGAVRDVRSAQELYEAAGNRLMATWARETVGMFETLRGDHAAALPILEQSTADFEALGESFGVRTALAVESRALMHLGRLDEARTLNRRVVELAVAEKDVASLSAVLLDAAALACLSGDLEQAAVLTGAAQRVVDESGAQPPRELVNRIEALPALEQALEPGVLHRLLSEGRHLSAEQARDLVLGP